MRPTASAYEQVCKARDKWHARADRAKAENVELRKALREAEQHYASHSGAPCPVFKGIRALLTKVEKP